MACGRQRDGNKKRGDTDIKEFDGKGIFEKEKPAAENKDKNSFEQKYIEKGIEKLHKGDGFVITTAEYNYYAREQFFSKNV
jgi:NAD(P)H-dependent FMN reductase